jgi:hypothetical protein
MWLRDEWEVIGVWSVLCFSLVPLDRRETDEPLSAEPTLESLADGSACRLLYIAIDRILIIKEKLDTADLRVQDRQERNDIVSLQND